MAYAHGIGVSKNDAEAYTWFLLAAAKGTYLAREAMTLIEGSMTAKQRAEESGSIPPERKLIS